ncbi:MAG: tetratricopeptide repeat protein [Lautropia sp.]
MIRAAVLAAIVVATLTVASLLPAGPAAAQTAAERIERAAQSNGPAAASGGKAAASDGDTTATGAMIADPALAALLDQARRLLQQREPQRAYALLEPATGRYAGIGAFDYLLGIAALDSGRPALAVIALERLLAVAPDDALARAEIARAYLALRERDAARREFQSVARADLPPEVRDTVARYLDILGDADRAADGRGGRRWRASVEASVGYDGNANLGSSLDRWVLGDGQALTPLPSSRPQRSPFAELSGQFQYVVPIDGRTDWTIGAQASQRTHASQHNVDLGAIEVSSGLALTRGPHRYTASIQVQQLFLDDRSFRRAIGVLGQWQRDLDARSQVGAYAQLFTLDFDDQSVRDARRAVIGGTFARGLDDRARSVVVGNAYLGRESSRRGLGELSFDLIGMRAGFSRQLTAGWRGTATAGYELRRHDAPDAFFGIRRRDRQSEIRLGAEHELSPRLTVSPQLIHLRNASDLAPNDFRRTQALVSVRYRF